MYSKGMFSLKQRSKMSKFFDKGVKGLADEIANWPEVKK